MAQFSTNFRGSPTLTRHRFTVIIQKPRMKNTLILYSQVSIALESKNWILISLSPCQSGHNNRKCVHTTKKLYDWVLSIFLLFFREDLVRIRRLFQKNFQSNKKYFSCHPPKAVMRRLRTGMELYLNIVYCIQIKKDCCFPRCFQPLRNSTLLWSRFLRVRYKNFVQLQGYIRASLEWFLAARIHPRLDDTLLNIPWLYSLWKHCTMHR